MEKFAIGVLLGGLAGALLTANNYKMRTLVKKGQEEVQVKLDKMMGKKIDEMEDKVEELKTEGAEKTEDLSKKARKAAEKKA